MSIKHVTKMILIGDFKFNLTGISLTFGLHGAAPCRMLSPVLDELAGEMEGKVKVLKVNVDEEPELASKFGVMSIPTVIAFKQGKVTNKVVGFRSKEDFKNML